MNEIINAINNSSLEELLENGEVDSKDFRGLTPLMLAIIQQKTDIVELLLKN